jgi:hypothetical protein
MGGGTGRGASAAEWLARGPEKERGGGAGKKGLKRRVGKTAGKVAGMDGSERRSERRLGRRREDGSGWLVGRAGRDGGTVAGAPEGLAALRWEACGWEGRRPPRRDGGGPAGGERGS